MMNNAILRFSTASIGAAFLTLALFYLMVILITQEFKLPVATTSGTITFVKAVKMEPPKIKDYKQVKPIPPETVPLPPMRSSIIKSEVPGIYQKITGYKKNHSSEVIFGLSDGGMLPLVSVQPNYPRRAAERGVEGYTIVEFDVSAQGMVKNPRIIEHHPNSVFDAESIKAIQKFKFKPEIVNGKAIPRNDIMKRFKFELEQG
ncbi:MAG: protein TonB [Candidatus Azotimanducaceae bacterium]|jgi:protein TonB